VAEPLKLIAVTLPMLFPEGEAALIELMLRRGIDRVHVRKPGAAEADVARLLDAIPPELRGRLSLHGFQSLAAKFGTGVHLNARNPSAPAGFRGMLSRSCHSLGELAADVDYQFLSPIFDSISKPGYHSRFDPEKLRVDASAIALGGVTPEKFAALRRAGFGGAAMSGYIWADRSPSTIKKRIDAAIHHSRQ